MNSLDLSSKEFHQLSERILEITTEYLQHIDARAIAAAGNGLEIERTFRSPLPEVGLGAQAINDLREVTWHSRAQNARFLPTLWVPSSDSPRERRRTMLQSVTFISTKILQLFSARRVGSRSGVQTISDRWARSAARGRHEL